MMKKRQKGTIYNKNVTAVKAYTHTPHTHTHKPTTNQKPGTKYTQEKKISLKSIEKMIKNKSQV